MTPRFYYCYFVVDDRRSDIRSDYDGNNDNNNNNKQTLWTTKITQEATMKNQSTKQAPNQLSVHINPNIHRFGLPCWTYPLEAIYGGAGPSFSPHTHPHTLSHTHSPPTLPQRRPALPSLSFFFSFNSLRTHTLAPDPLPFALIFLALVCLLSPYPRCPDCDLQCFLHARLTKPQKEKREALGSIYKELERYMNRNHK